MNKLKIVGIVAVLLLLACLVGPAQAGAKFSAPAEEWNRTFGGSSSDRGYSVAQTSDGGYIITGETYSYGAGEQDVWLIKTDPKGNKEWDKTFGGSDNDRAYSVAQTPDGGYVLVGQTSVAGYADVWLIKTDSEGNKEWDKTFGGKYTDYGCSVAQTSDMGYIITGLTDSYSVGMRVWLIKTDSKGNEEWNKTFFDSSCGYSVIQTSDEGYVIVGETYWKSYANDIWLIKTDSKGNEEWNKTFGGSDDDGGFSVTQTSDGGYIITGYTCSYGAGGNEHGWSIGAYGAGRGDVWLIKTDSKGNKEWDKTFGGSGDDVGFSVTQTSDRGYIITGYTCSYGAGDVWLIKTDSEGNKIWDKTFGGSAFDSGYSVTQTSDGGYIITGETNSYGGCNIYLVKVEAGPKPKIQITNLFETENSLNQEIVGKVFNYEAPSLDVHVNGELQKIELRNGQFDEIIKLKEGKNKIEFVIDGEVYKTINISTVEFEIPKETYSFTNSEFTEEYALTYDQFNNLLRSYLAGVSAIKANIIAPFVFVSTEKGNCYGMSSTAILYHEGMKKPVDKDVYEMNMSEAAPNIHGFQVGQVDHLLTYYVNYLLEPDEKISYDCIVESIEKEHKPVVLTTWLKVHDGLEALYDALTGKYQSHAVVAYKTYEFDGKKHVVVYENNGKYPEVKDCTGNAIFDFSKKYAFTYRSEPVDSIHEVPYAFYPTVGTNTVINTIVDNFLHELIKLLHSHGLKLISVSCPVNVSLTDESGRVIADDGTNQIPNAKVIATDDVKLFFVPEDLTYSVNIDAYEEGNFTLTQFSSIGDKRANATEFNSSVTPETKASILISPEKVSEMKIDYDGNGMIDEEKKPVKEIIEVAIKKPTGEEKGILGFEAMSAVAGLLTVAYVLRRRNK